VVRRQFQRDDLLSRAWVGHVAADDEHGLWVWVATGSPYRDIAAADGRSFRDVPFGEWGRTAKAMAEQRWNGNVLMLHPADGGAYSVWFFFAPDGTFRTWYVNLEEPMSRWDDGQLAGVDTVDYDLDVVVQPDRSWHWKDADEFAYHLAYPDVYWVDDSAAVWKEGERVIGLVEAGQFPFDGTRTDFRPDPQWTVPATMPPGWDRARE
jgi:hypothetical protein